MTKSAFSRQYARFRSILIDARKSAGLTQVELAQKLKRPQSFVSKYERGERRLDVVEFLDVSRVLNLDSAAVLAEVDARPRTSKKERS